MNPVLDDACCQFGKRIIGQYLFAIQQEIAGVRSATDLEAIHRMRVASRRVRAVMELFLPCYSTRQQKQLKKQIRQLTNALGKARDLDVQIELINQISKKNPENRLSPGFRRILLRLSQDRSALQPDIVRAMQNLETSGVLDLQVSPPVDTGGELTPVAYTKYLYLVAAQAIRSRLSDFLAFEPFITDPSACAQLHAMRIAAKWLRYNMETFSTLYPDNLKGYLQSCRVAQELLGQIHDCDVWSLSLPSILEEEKNRIHSFYGHTRPFLPLIPGFQFLMENRRQERIHSYELLLQNWKKWNSNQLWSSLIDRIEQPLHLIPSGELYPPQAPVTKTEPLIIPG